MDYQFPVLLPTSADTDGVIKFYGRPDGSHTVHRPVPMIIVSNVDSAEDAVSAITALAKHFNG